MRAEQIFPVCKQNVEVERTLPAMTKNAKTSLIREINVGSKYFYLRMYGMLRRARALATGKRFRCLALEGKGVTDICINSDMTVSCNCRDYDGSGIIGDLEKESWHSVFAENGGRIFREALAEGNFPTTHCPRCRQLRETSAESAADYAKTWSLSPPGIMVENMAECNCSCIGCVNHEMLKARKKISMSLADVRKVTGILRDNSIRHVDYFKLGEPFLSRNILAEMQIIREENPDLDIMTSTNGFFVDTEEKREAALLFTTVCFAISGATQESIERYQVGGDFARAYENMKAVVRLRHERGLARPNVFWRLLVFNWNDSRDETEKALSFAREAGVDGLQFVGAINPIYGVSRRFYTSRFWNGVVERNGMVRYVDLR